MITCKSMCCNSESRAKQLTREPEGMNIKNNNNNNNNNNHDGIYSAVIMTEIIARVHSVHLVNVQCRTASPTFRPSHLTWAVSLPVIGSYCLQPTSPFIIITQPESWYSFTVPRTVEGWVDLGTAWRVHTARAQGCKSLVFTINTTACSAIRSQDVAHCSQACYR